MTVLDMRALRAAFALPVRRPVTVLAAAAPAGLAFALAGLASGWALWIAAVAAVAALTGALAVYGRLALSPDQDVLRGLGADMRRLAITLGLITILVLTVPGTALVALAFMLAALALINVDPDAGAPEGFVNIFALFGTGEWIAAIVLIAVFAAFSLWFIARLAPALPATLAAGRVQVLTVWPLSSKRAPVIALTLAAAAAPGIVLVSLAAQALAGWDAGLAGRALGAFVLASAAMVFSAAPVMAALGALFMKNRS